MEGDKLIVKLGFGPNPDCPSCKGAGFLHPRLEIGEPDFSRVVPCKAPGCYGNSYTQYTLCGPYQESGINYGKSFETFVPVPGAKKALEDARQLADGTADFIWLLIYGGVGNGKTHLAYAIAKATIERGVNFVFYRVADMFSAFRRGIEDKTIDQEIQALKRAPMLILDDYGVEYGSEWEAAKLDEILTARFDNLKPTVMTTNKDKNQLPDRIRSRFEDGQLSRTVHNAAPDFRKTKQAR